MKRLNFSDMKVSSVLSQKITVLPGISAIKFQRSSNSSNENECVAYYKAFFGLHSIEIFCLHMTRFLIHVINVSVLLRRISLRLDNNLIEIRRINPGTNQLR